MAVSLSLRLTSEPLSLFRSPAVFRSTALPFSSLRPLVRGPPLARGPLDFRTAAELSTPGVFCANAQLVMVGADVQGMEGLERGMEGLGIPVKKPKARNLGNGLSITDTVVGPHSPASNSGWMDKVRSLIHLAHSRFIIWVRVRRGCWVVGVRWDRVL